MYEEQAKNIVTTTVAPLKGSQKKASAFKSH